MIVLCPGYIVSHGRALDLTKYHLDHTEAFVTVTAVLDSGEKLFAVFSCDGVLYSKDISGSPNPELEFNTLQDLAHDSDLTVFYYAVEPEGLLSQLLKAS